ncbi:hypothetical protein LWE61_14955 [Sphingobium sufflavum]|uniref:hypothetical protein n=1 Tax=Sphingobium sufflavum TaxID=1129547 RepID=UPI001F452DC4|nr:hypothetical protein [Sphingobium sufflavum]MCE7797849.1 hypothetical protein [Sphingobium sufflavum]
MSFGMGLGAFMNGVQGGLKLGQQVRGVIDDRKTRKMERSAIEDARAARERDIGDLTRGPAIPADPSGMIDEKGAVRKIEDTDLPISRDEAEKKVGSFMDYYRSTSVPKLIEGYIQRGENDRAAHFQQYLDSEDGKARTKDWSVAAQRFAMGDHEGGFKRLADLNGRIGNGMDLVGHEQIMQPIYEDRTDKKTGKTTKVQTGTEATGGWRVKWKDSDSGKEFSQDFASSDDFARTALWATSPEQQVTASLAELRAAQAARAKAVADAAGDRRQFGYDIGKLRAKGVIDDQAAGREAQRTASRDATLHGYRMEEDVNGAQASAAYRAPPADSVETPEDVRKSLENITKRLSESDPSFYKLSPEEQTARAVSVLNGQRSSARGVMSSGAPSGGRGVMPPLY